MNFQDNYEYNPNTGVLTTQTSFSTFPNSNGSAFETASFGQNPEIFFVDQDGDRLFTSSAIQNGSYSRSGPLESLSAPASVSTSSVVSRFSPATTAGPRASLR